MKICDKCGAKADAFNTEQIVVNEYDTNRPAELTAITGISPTYYDLCPRCYGMYKDFVDVSTVNWMKEKLKPLDKE